MSGNARRGNGHRRDSVLRWLRSQGGCCWMCGLPIAYGAQAGDPLAFECDELVPVSRGGSPYDRENVAPAHRICNNWRGDKPVGRVLSVRSRVLARFGQWSTPQQFVTFAKALDGGRAPSAASAPRVTTDW